MKGEIAPHRLRKGTGSLRDVRISVQYLGCYKALFAANFSLILIGGITEGIGIGLIEGDLIGLGLETGTGTAAGIAAAEIAHAAGPATAETADEEEAGITTTEAVAAAVIEIGAIACRETGTGTDTTTGAGIGAGTAARGRTGIETGRLASKGVRGAAHRTPRRRERH